MIDMTCDNDVDMKYSFMTPSILYIMKYAQWVVSSLNQSYGGSCEIISFICRTPNILVKNLPKAAFSIRR